MHLPCCHACWFNSHEQVDFEDDVAGMISTLELTVESLLGTLLRCRKYTDLVDRLKHFFVSPRYPVIIRDLRRLDDSLIRVVSVEWSSYYAQAEKYHHWLKIYHDQTGLSAALNRNRLFETAEEKVTRRGARPCKGICREPQRRIGTDHEQSHLVSVYDPSVEGNTDSGDSASDESDGPFGSFEDSVTSHTLQSRRTPSLSERTRSLTIGSEDVPVVEPILVGSDKKSSRSGSLRSSRGRPSLEIRSLLNIVSVREGGDSIRGKYTGISSTFGSEIYEP